MGKIYFFRALSDANGSNHCLSLAGRRLGGRATFLLEGDALAAPQGRAEDIFAGILVHTGKRWSVKAGYRFLEGGADNDEVYTFALVHYLAAGVVVRF